MIEKGLLPRKYHFRSLDLIQGSFFVYSISFELYLYRRSAQQNQMREKKARNKIRKKGQNETEKYKRKKKQMDSKTKVMNSSQLTNQSGARAHTHKHYMLRRQKHPKQLHFRTNTNICSLCKILN
jgi:hypothetical protein